MQLFLRAMFSLLKCVEAGLMGDDVAEAISNAIKINQTPLKLLILIFTPV